MRKWTRALYQPGLPLGQDGRRVTASPAHIALSKEAAKEGMVLLKNENAALPLKKGTKVALFGKATFDYVKGGGGSGDVTVPYARNLYEGFRCLDCVELFEPLAEFYRGFVEEQYRQGVLPGQIPEPALSAEMIGEAARFADTAVINICRFSGEGADRAPEDFYLSADEKQMVEAVTDHFDRVIAVLNIGGVISAEWFCAEPRIQAALLAWQGGLEGGLAAAELLCGIGSPSGKLADTFAENIADYPSTATFGESEDHVTYTEDIYVGYRYFETIPGARDRVIYPFGYGLSYTAFEIRCLKASVSGMDEAVFTVSVKNTGRTAGKEVVQLYVEAPGQKIEGPARKLIDFAKTPELAPGESCTLTLKASPQAMSSYDECGAIEKSAWVMEAGRYHFYVGNNVRDAKEVLFAEETGEIAPESSVQNKLWTTCGGRATLARNIVTEVCSQKMAPVERFPRLRCDGSYAIVGEPECETEKLPPVGTGAETVEATAQDVSGTGSVGIVLPEGTESGTAGDIILAETETNAPEDILPEDAESDVAKAGLMENRIGLRPLKWEEMECVLPETRRVRRRCFLLKEEKVPQLINVYRTRQKYGADRIPQPEEQTAGRSAGTICGEEDGVPFTCEPLTLKEFISALPDRELAELLGGQPNTGLANTCGVGNLPRYGVPAIMTADGPAGLRIEKQCGVTTTAWPCATMLACTWDPELAERIGQAAAEEVKENNIGIWLAPAVNIHRNPLCGRNFEYYSEDPVLAGRMGAGMVRGIQSRNIVATVKHFALNNKEQNRKESDSRASERAIREIYLKVFEIIVKEAGPWAIMSSYNIINGTRASERKDMLTDILRGEWGYEGVVMTDWWAFSEQYKEILAGNDLKMACGYPERLLEAMEKGLITRADLERSAARVLELILKID